MNFSPMFGAKALVAQNPRGGKGYGIRLVEIGPEAGIPPPTRENERVGGS